MNIKELSTPAVCAGAVPITATIQTIEPPQNTHYHHGSNGHHEPAKDTRFAWLSHNLKRKDVSPLARCVLGWMVTAAQWRKDRLMIVGKSEIAQEFRIDTRRVDRCILELIAAGCLRLVDKGGSLRGQKRKANTYALGTAFEGTPPKARKARLGVNTPPVKEERLGVKTANDRGYICPPLPIVPPIYTHTKELPAANNKETPRQFTLENWMAHTASPALFPGWPSEDRKRCFELAKAKGYETDETWVGCCAFYFKQWQRHNAKPSPAVIAQKAFSNPAPRPAVRSSCESPRIGGLPFDGLSKEEWHAKESGWYGLGGRDNWIKAGCPHLAGRSQAEKDSAVAALIARHALMVG